jgi:hypothetical protein
MARASRPPKIRLRPQLRKDTDIDISATKLTAVRAVAGMRASRLISFATGGEVATT